MRDANKARALHTRGSRLNIASRLPKTSENDCFVVYKPNVSRIITGMRGILDTLNLWQF